MKDRKGRETNRKEQKERIRNKKKQNASESQKKIDFMGRKRRSNPQKSVQNRFWA